MTDINDAMGCALALFMLGCAALIAALIAALLLDGAQAVRAERQTFACRAQQMEAVRRTFTTDVTCVPALTRRDTLTIGRTE